MTTEAADIQKTVATPHEENQRAASEFDARMKTAQPVEVTDGNNAAAVPVKEAAKPVASAAPPDDGIPEHVVSGEAPAKVAAAAAKDDELEAIQPPAKMSQEGIKNFANLRGLAERRGAEVARLTAELAAVKATKSTSEADPQTAELVKTATERAAMLEAELERAAFERSPRYKALVEEQTQAVTAAKSYLEGTDIPPSVIDRAASLTGAKRLAVLREAGVDAETIAMIGATLAGHDSVGGKREAALAQHKTLQAEWARGEQLRNEQQEAQIKAQEERTFTEVVTRIAKSYAPFQKYEGHDQWNAQADGLVPKAKAILNAELPFEKLVEAAHAAAAYDVMERMFTNAQAKLKSANAELAKLKAAQPGAGEGAARSNGSNGHTAASNDASTAAVAARFDERMGR